MTTQNYGAIGAVILSYLCCRLLAWQIIDAFGDLGRHHRAAETVIGIVVVAVPFVILMVFTALRLRDPDALHTWPARLLFIVGWLAAGGVMGLLPYSRMGAQTNLIHTEATTAPGFLHGVDMAILVGLLVTIGMLLIAVRQRAALHNASSNRPTKHLEEDP